ncbi:MAG: IS200/IS605 family accessory protein TnpB-related protein [Aquificota bacterium]
MITISAKLLFSSYQDKEKVLNLMRIWSSAMRYAYKRFLEGMEINTLRKLIQDVFGLNSRYSHSAIVKAQALMKLRKEKGQSLKKVIFGGRDIFRKLQKRHINGKDYQRLKIQFQERRKGNLYSIGQRHLKGNQNTRIEVKEDRTYLRINTGERQYVYALISAGDRIEKIKEIAFSGRAYSVELKLRDGNVYAYFTAEEEYPQIEITKAYGVIGIDLNAYPNHIAWAETDEYGNLLSYGEIAMPELGSGNGNKRDYYTWIYAHKVMDLAKEKGKAIVIEKLRIKDKGKRGDYSGRLSRRIRHNFAYRKLLERIKLLAKRDGIEVIEVNPAYTSIIGMLKYAPQHMVSKDIASAYVIARKGLGLKEKVPKNYVELLRKLSIEELKELKEYVREKVKNAYLKAKHMKEISYLIKSLESEPRRVSEPLEGTSLGTQFNPWRVLKVVVLTALSPERVIRDLSVLKDILFRGLWGDPKRARAPTAGGRGVVCVKTQAIFETP